MLPLAEAEINDLLGNPDAAIKAYSRSIELGMQEPPVIRRAVQLLFDRRRYDQAFELIKKLQEQGFPSRDSQLTRLAAEVSLQVNERTRALELARKAIPANSKDYRDHLWLGQILVAAGEPGKAEPEFRRAVAIAGAAPDAWISLVRFLAGTARRPDALAAIAQARQLAHR